MNIGKYLERAIQSVGYIGYAKFGSIDDNLTATC